MCTIMLRWDQCLIPVITQSLWFGSCYSIRDAWFQLSETDLAHFPATWQALQLLPCCSGRKPCVRLDSVQPAVEAELGPGRPTRGWTAPVAPLMTRCGSSCGLFSAGRPDPEPRRATAGRAARSGRTHRRATTSLPERQHDSWSLGARLELPPVYAAV